MTHIPDVNRLTTLGSGSSIIREGIRRHGAGCSSSSSIKAAATTTTTAAAGVSTAPSETTTEATATTTETSSTKAPAEAATHTTVATTTAKAHGAATTTTSKSIFANLKNSALPVVAIELLNGIASIFWTFENDNTRAFRPAIRADMDISSDDATNTSFKRGQTRSLIRGKFAVDLPAWRKRSFKSCQPTLKGSYGRGQ